MKMPEHLMRARPNFNKKDLNIVAGRDIEITRERIFELCSALEAGLSIKDAASYCGITHSTFFNWRNAGRALLDGEDHPKIPKLYERGAEEGDEEWEARLNLWIDQCNMLQELYLESQRARSGFYKELLGVISRRAFSDEHDAWRAARYLLSVGNREAYGYTNKQTQHSVSIKGDIQHSGLLRIHELYDKLGQVAGTATLVEEDIEDADFKELNTGDE